MAATHQWKVYTADKAYIASVKDPIYGAMLLAGLSIKGSTIRRGHRFVVWTDGADGWAAESYDVVNLTILKRIQSLPEFSYLANPTE